MAKIPVVLLGKDWWSKAVNIPFLAEQGLISPEDLDLFKMVDTADEAWAHVSEFWNSKEPGTLRRRHEPEQLFP